MEVPPEVSTSAPVGGAQDGAKLPDDGSCCVVKKSLKSGVMYQGTC